MSNYLIFNGVSSATWDFQVGAREAFSVPQRDVEKISVPGKNGDIVFDNGRFQNVDVTYKIFIANNFTQKLALLKNWLRSDIGYQRIEDSYYPDEYRVGRVSNITVDPRSRNRFGMVTVVFDCFPQKFLKSGEETMNIIDPDTGLLPSEFVVNNPTAYNALPIIRIYSEFIEDSPFRIDIGYNGSRRILFYFEDLGLIKQTYPDVEYVEIDMEQMMCSAHLSDSRDTTVFPAADYNINSFMIVNDPENMYLAPGDNSFTITAESITRFEIIPRWRTI